MKEDLINFRSPYTTKEIIGRGIWAVVWFCFAKPFPRRVANRWKITLLQMFGAKVARSSVVYSSAKIFMPWNLIMEEYACLGPEVDCYNAARITLKRNAIVSQYSFLCTASHDITDRNHVQIAKPIEIGERAWIAADVFIGPGVIVGEGAVVGARAVVFKDVEPWTVVGGNPARFIKKRIIGDE